MNSLLVTAHDYRTPRKANLHFIAEALVKHGPVRFFSVRYSRLSARTGDARLFLDDRANRVETVAGVDCFLWKAFVHPFNTRRPALRPLEDAMFRWAMAHPPAILERWVREADVILFESGSSILHVAASRTINPNARKNYLASDDLGVINAAHFVQEEFNRVAPTMDALCLPSPRLADGMPATSNQYFVPHGLDASMAERADPSPYTSALNAVSVGSMLFDRGFFETVAPAFPQMTFHVIGPGAIDRSGLPPNVRVYDEMHHDETLRYIKHARIGIAAYRAAEAPSYLADTSMKLMQYAFFGIASVCPGNVAGGVASRFGYASDSKASMVDAVRRALDSPRPDARAYLTWDAVADRLVDPSRYPDTAMPAPH